MREYCTIVRFQNITKAAEFLYTSQPSLSRHLSELEADLGVQLLVRGNTRIFMLTEAGKLLYEEANNLLDLVSNMNSRVRWLGTGNSGSLVLCAFNFHYQPFFDACTRFKMDYPDTSFTIYYNGNNSACQTVLQGKADMGVGFSFEIPEAFEEISTYKLCQDYFCVIVANNHSLAKRESVSLEDLQNELFLYIDSSLGDVTEKTGNAEKEMRNHLFNQKNKSVNDMESMFLQIRAGIGVGVLPCTIAREYCSGCKTLSLEQFSTVYDVVLMWKNTSSNPLLKRFLSVIDEFIPQK